MNGLIIKSKNSKILYICNQCFKREKKSITLALKLELIKQPLICEIDECKLCFKKD